MRFIFWNVFWIFLMTMFHSLIIYWYLPKYQSEIYKKYMITKENDILSVIEVSTFIVAFIPAAIITFFIEKKFKHYNLGIFDD